MKIEEEIEKDIPSRIKITKFDDEKFVSTVNNAIGGILNPLVDLRNDMFGAFPYETAIVDKNLMGSGRTLVVAHASSIKEALRNHIGVVNKILSDNNIDRKKWTKEGNKAFKKLLKK